MCADRNGFRPQAVAIWEWSNKSEVFGDLASASDPDGDCVAFELVLRHAG